MDAIVTFQDLIRREKNKVKQELIKNIREAMEKSIRFDLKLDDGFLTSLLENGCEIQADDDSFSILKPLPNDEMIGFKFAGQWLEMTYLYMLSEIKKQVDADAEDSKEHMKRSNHEKYGEESV